MFKASPKIKEVLNEITVGESASLVSEAKDARISLSLSGLLIALTYIGGELAQLMLGLPGASIQLFQGMLLFFLLATDLFANYRVKIGTN